jgi:hypothetical protein
MHCDIKLPGLAAQWHGLSVSVSMAQTVNSIICRVCFVPDHGELRHTVVTARTVVAVCCSYIYCVGHCRRTRAFPALSKYKWILWILRSAGILRSVQWKFLTDVSGQPVGPGDITQRTVEIPCRRFGTTCRSRGYYAVYSRNSLPTFRDNLSVQGILRSVQWKFLTHVSGQPVGPGDITQRTVEIPCRRFGTTCRSRGYYAAYSGNPLPTFRDSPGADRFSRNVGEELPLYPA